VTAAVISTSEPERLYSGLSVLVSQAVDGERCAALLAFKGLELFLDPDLGGDDLFGRSLRELRDTARELDGLRLYACAASVQTTGIEPAGLEVMSTPRFLREVARECLLFV
jgi:predicted peroxiredoxin